MYSAKRRFRLFRLFTKDDAIATALTTSKATYSSTPIGSWVKITSAEYLAVRAAVTNTTIVALTDSGYTYIRTYVSSWGATILANARNPINQPPIPANSYVYAVSFYIDALDSSIRVWANNSTNNVSSEGRSNFQQVGTVLPTTTYGDNYYVFKGAVSVTAVTEGLLGMSSSNGRWAARALTAAGSILAFTSTPTPTTQLNTSSSDSFAIQGLTTTVKQW